MTERNRFSRREVLGAVGLSALPSLVHAHPSAPEERILAPSRQSADEMERFVADCVRANQGADAQEAVKEVLARAVSEPAEVLKAVGEPTEAGLKVFHRSETLTIFAAAWTPQMNLMPHNHLMWAAIGIYAGREDNILWRRENGSVEAYGVQCLFEGDVATLPETAIHSVTNPLERFTGGLHIYGGDFFATERSQWNPDTLDEEPSNGDVIRAMFARANERMNRMREP